MTPTSGSDSASRVVPGVRLGPFEVLEKLGSGGMGEVYRARDSALDREVALKILPPEVAGEPERLARFRQEAKLLAAISHPNIASIYTFEHIDGVRFFTQELVRGRTVRARMAGGALPIEDALNIAQQVAEALEASHARDIVHRDLKPSNVMVGDDGTVKVLDFGLARPVAEDDAEMGATGIGDSTPTVSSVRPEGTILGTAQYMSPDQARGRVVDSRADVWSFGCVLYEMLAGKRAFDGDTLLDTLASVVRSEPDWSALPANTPPPIRELLRRCLRKKTRERLQHIGDARIIIGETLEALEGGETFEAPVAAAAAAPLPPARMAVAPVAVAALVLGAALGAALMWWLAPADGDDAFQAHLEMTLGPIRLTVDPASAIAIAPDGTEVVFAATSETGVQLLHRRRLTDFTPEPILGTEGAVNPFFSPNGEWVAFFAERELRKIRLNGGTAFTITGVPVGSAGGAWLTDDTIVFGTRYTATGLMEVPAAGGTPRPLTEPNVEQGEKGHEWPVALPDGRSVLYTVLTDGEPWVGMLTLGEDQQPAVFTAAPDARYSPTGHLVYSRDGTLFAIAFDLATRLVSGDPVSLFGGLFTNPTIGRGVFDLSPAGTLVYVPGDARVAPDRLVWVDRQGAVTPTGIQDFRYGHPKLSPDGSRVAVDADPGGNGDIWVYELARNSRVRLTSEFDNSMPVWDPTGQRIAFNSNRGGNYGLYWKNADGSGAIGVLRAEADASLWPRSWGPTGIAYYELNTVTGRDIWIWEHNDDSDGDGVGDGQPRIFANTPFNERSPAFSPDGRWVAYVSDESGRDEIYVREDVPGGRAYAISTDGGLEPVWARDGGELFYRNGNAMMAVEVRTGGRFEVGTPVELFRGDFARDTLGQNQFFDVDVGGQRFLMIRREDNGPDHLHVIIDWARELRADMDAER